MRAELEGRPLLVAALSLIAGLSAVWHPQNLVFLVVLLALTHRSPARFFAAGAFLMGLLIAPSNDVPVETLSGGFRGVVAVVSVPFSSDRGTACEVEKGANRYVLNVKGTPSLALGQRLSVRGRLRRLHGEVAQRQSLEGASYSIASSPDEVQILEQAPNLFRWSASWRTSFVNWVNANLSDNGASAVDSLGFGAGRGLATDVRRDFLKTGAIHILSASGIQVAMLAFLLQSLLSCLPIPRWVQISLIGLILVLYVCAAGLHPSTIRAALIAVLALVAYVFQREADFLSALGLAAIATVLWQPWSIYTPGFQLSFVTVAALSHYWRPLLIEGHKRLIDRIAARCWMIVGGSTIASVATAPIIAYHFGEVSIVSPLTNLLIGVVLGPVIVLSMLGWALSSVAPAVSLGILKFAVAPLAAWILWVVTTFGAQPWASVTVPTFNPYWMVPYYGAVMIACSRSLRS